MAQLLPITLVGHNLGERHHYLNSLVNDAYRQKVSFESVQNLPEQSEVDRLFKIDLASKYRNVEYIVQNLKDDDMLYVSRALNCTWLLEQQYSNIINPDHLENILFPEMTTTAVNKMRHWIHLHLKDASRCQEFFQHYFSKNLELAMKFLWNCSAAFITAEIKNVTEAITPQHFKLLCEKCPEAIDIYYDALASNQDLLFNYMDHEVKYVHNIIYLLKVNPDLFFNFIEKYYSKNFGPFKSSATLYIMKNHRNRFWNKPELYAFCFFDINTLTKCLSADESKDLVLKLARANYLSSWFNYKRVEPLIKHLRPEERAAFKQKVFVDKSFGDKVEKWPYPIPSSLSSKFRYLDTSVFSDKEYEPIHVFRPCMKKRKALNYFEKHRLSSKAFGCARLKTFLDRLYDRYRFDSFDKTLFDLRNLLTAESSSQNREYMMLVLVSKSGGHAENLQVLLELLVTQHKNEPPHVRAAVVRSLVKRAAAWRMPASCWRMLLDFARGLGLDGAEPEAACLEGLHTVVLRDILAGSECESAVFSAFMRQFSTFTDYKLNSAEKRQVVERLPVLILSAVEAEPSLAAEHLKKLLSLLEAYRIPADACTGVLPAILTLFQREPSSGQELLQRLYNARVARKLLFRENFTFIQTNSSYLNALRHDARLLAVDKFQALAEKNLRHDRFLQKLAVYFSEKNGLAERFLAVLENVIDKNPSVDLARSLAFLAGNTLSNRLKELDKQPAKSVQRQFAAQLRANAHLCRPKLDLDTFGWRVAGAKAVANKIVVCKTLNIQEYVHQLISWRRTVKLALIMAPRSGQEVDIFTRVAYIKPTVAVKVGLQYLQSGNNHDLRLWDTIKPLLTQLDLSEPRFKNLCNALLDVDCMPKSVQSEYCSIVFNALPNSSQKQELLNIIAKILPECDENFVQSILMTFINNEVTSEKLNFSNNEVMWRNLTCYGRDEENYYLTILAKFLLLCRSEDAQRHRFEVLGKLFLNRIKAIWETSEKKERLIIFLRKFVEGLKYIKVFLDTSYVSCLPVFEYVLDWIKNAMSIEECFEIYVNMNLTMLYFKSIRQGINNEPGIFAEKATRDKEGVEVVGKLLGQYITSEVLILAKTYFDSIVVLYAQKMLKYFDTFEYGESRDKLLNSVAKGYLEASLDSNNRMLVLKCFVNNGNLLREDLQQEIVQLVRKYDDPQIKFFLPVPC